MKKVCEILSLHAISLSDTIFIFFQTNIQKHQKYHWGFLDKCWCNNYSKHVHISHTSILQPTIFRIKIFNFNSGISWYISYTVLFVGPQFCNQYNNSYCHYIDFYKAYLWPTFQNLGHVFYKPQSDKTQILTTVFCFINSLHDFIFNCLLSKLLGSRMIIKYHSLI